MRRCTCKKHKIDIRDINQESLAFYMRHCIYKKHKIDVRDINREPLTFYTCWFNDRACDQK
jgi:hypothetical protein